VDSALLGEADEPLTAKRKFEVTGLERPGPAPGCPCRTL